MLPPIMVDKASTVHAKVGNTVVINSDGVTNITTDNANMLEVSLPHTDGSASFNGGAKVLTTGQGKLTVYGANNKLLYVVTVVSP